MTPRIGASGADWSTAQAPGLDRPGVNPVPRTGASEAAERVRNKHAPDWSIRGGLEHGSNPRTGSSGGAPGATDWNIRGNGTDPQDWNIRGAAAIRQRQMEPGLEHPGTQCTQTGTSGGAEALDWSVRGRSGPGLERPGQQEEKETAAERNREENKNKSKEQMGKDTTDESCEVGGEGAKGKAANHVEPRRGQPGKQCTRTGSSRREAAIDSSVRGSIRKKKPWRQETARSACTRVRNGGERGREEQEKVKVKVKCSGALRTPAYR